MSNMQDPIVLHSVLGALPGNAEYLTPYFAYCRDGDWVTFFNKSGPVLLTASKDRFEVRLASGILTDLGDISPPAIAEALQVHPDTVRSAIRIYQEQGLSGLVEKKRGPKGAHKLKLLFPEIQRQLNQGIPVKAIARELGISDTSIRHSIKLGRLVRPEKSGVDTVDPDTPEVLSPPTVASPSERAIEDQTASDAGVAVKRTLERMMAAVGLLGQAVPQFSGAEAVPGAGVLLALPQLLKEGLLEVGEAVYDRLPKGFYGLQSTLILLAFMALLRIRNPEQLETRAPGELGRLLGLDRSPEVKTLRRKIKALSSLEKAGDFVSKLASHWASKDPTWSTVLYVDGHVRVYEGRKHKLLKTYAPRRKQCQAGEKEYWVNDRVGNPLFFVLSPTNEGILKVMENKIFPEVRELVGKEARPLVVFDREGWSPDRFESFWKNGFDILTYRKGEYEDWPEDEFQKVPLYRKKKAGKDPEAYRMAVRNLPLRKPSPKDPDDKGFTVPEIRFLDGSSQISVVTTSGGTAHEMVALLKGRWRQENFFRYMREEYALDHVITHAMELEDPDKLVTNPARKKQEKLLGKARQELGALEQETGARAMKGLDGRPARRRGRPKSTDADLLGEAIELRKEVTGLEEELAILPKEVPRSDLLEVENIVRRDSGRKLLTGAIKMLAYRTETWLYRFMFCFNPTWTERDRGFIKSVFQLPGDILPDEKEGTLTIRLHPPSTWRWKRGLEYLCGLATRKEAIYPGTKLRLVYEVLNAE